jgi:hypothetical protein
MSIKENKSQNMEYLDKSSQHCSYNKSKWLFPQRAKESKYTCIYITATLPIGLTSTYLL